MKDINKINTGWFKNVEKQIIYNELDLLNHIVEWDPHPSITEECYQALSNIEERFGITVVGPIFINNKRYGKYIFAIDLFRDRDTEYDDDETHIDSDCHDEFMYKYHRYLYLENNSIKMGKFYRLREYRDEFPQEIDNLSPFSDRIIFDLTDRRLEKYL